MQSFSKNILLAAITTTLCSTTMASSHREAPFITGNPKVDATDFYMFRSYESGREDYVTLIANYNPLQDAYGGPNYFSMSPDALYEFHIDNNGDAVEDISFQFTFNNSLGNQGAGISLAINGKDIAVPLKNVGAVTSSDSSALNFKEDYSITMVKGDRRTGSNYTVVDTNSGVKHFAKPYDNVGDKTFGTQAYADYAQHFIHDVTLSGCPSGAQKGRVFVGQRKESFAVNLGAIFDLVNLDPVGKVDGANNTLANKNITSLALEVPVSCLTGGNTNGIIGGWTSASLPQVRVLDPSPTFSQPAVSGGAWTQVSRLGMPLVNEVVIGLPDKNLFNASEPKDDAQFADYVTNPTLPALLEVLFGVKAPTVKNRPDLVAAFLTGLEGVNKNGSVSEMQRLNTTIAPTAKDAQKNLGVAVGDNAGFPNGRRPGDDSVDVALRVSMGVLCHLNLGLCKPEDAANGTLPYTDGALQNAAQFDAVFPYLTTPVSGSK
ncbi:MAG: DUF4331 domain-containing protein [Cocleimonas sp.]|nr:DUF4331 domain-containing protein [Cocleimonas sp.]